MDTGASQPPIDLSNCDREPIHIPGQIQAHGALLIAEKTTWKIVQGSTNVATFLNQDISALLGTNVLELFDPPGHAFITHAAQQSTPERMPVHLAQIHVAQRGPFDVILHIDGPLLLLEIELIQAGSETVSDFYAFASRAILSLQSNLTTREYCRAVTSFIQQVTGYDRVMIYRFSDDWSGHVWAESMARNKGLLPFLDLHYPASDIPVQARALFLKNNVRMLVDAAYVASPLVPEVNPITGYPLDMSHTFLRGASPMYTEYLTNMGVRASLTLALLDDNRLWGLVACHHLEPRHISYGVRVVCELIARVASLQIVDKMRKDQADYRLRIQAAHSALLEALAVKPNLVSTLAKMTSGIRTFLDCAGAAVVSGGEVSAEGATPPPHHVLRIIETLQASEKNKVVATERISTLYPDAASFVEVACGMIALPLSSTPGDYVLWFRPEIVQTVTWAGDPNKPMNVSAIGNHFTPRTSFERWAETVRGASQPWTTLEIEAVKRLSASVTELLLRRNQELERLNVELVRSNEELDSFAYVASHDLKEPLRGIYNYADFLLRDADDRWGAEGVQKLESIVRLTRRMHGLIDSLLEYSRVGRVGMRPERVALSTLLARVVDSIAPTIHERHAVIRIDDNLPTVSGFARFFEQIFSNLLTNAMKYNEQRIPEVQVGCMTVDDAAYPVRATGMGHVFFVRDNGIGIDPRHHQTVFRIFKRLHSTEKFGGGTGAGLTIVKKLIDRLGGTVWIESQPSAGTTVWFSLPAEEVEVKPPSAIA